MPPPQVIEKRSDGFARVLAFVALVGAGVTFAMSQLPEVPQGSAAKLASLQDEVRGLAGQPAGGGDESAAEIAALREQLGTLRGELENLTGSVETLRETASAPAEAGPDLSGDLAALADRLKTLEDRPETPPSINTTVGSGVSEETIAGLNQQLNDLASKLGSLEGQLETVKSEQKELDQSLDSRISGLRSDLEGEIGRETQEVMGRLEELSAKAEAAGDARQGRLAQQAALVLAVGRLRDAVGTGKSYSGAWDAVVELGVDPAAHPAVAGYAATGVPTLDALQDRFPVAASRTMVANQVGEDESWVGGALRRVGNLVNVRRTGELEGDSVEAVLARAEARLNEGDLDAAVGELSALEGAAAKEIAPWKADAEARLSLDKAVGALQVALFDGLAKGN
ncbi:MAG: mitofilin family membrane protein [Minwuia sp.]|uniref:mitofilin family membrane protein n=1 Tax=Minwuia sp. TaxID=2493630 RepID=UPI003A87FABD